VLDAILNRMLSPKNFLTEYWRKRPAYVPGAAREFAGLYGIDDFLTDLAETQPAPYLVTGVCDGERAYSHPDTPEELRSTVEAGSVAPMRISPKWHQPDMSAHWEWIRALYGGLCRSTSMIYMPRMEAVDLFLGGPKSHLGVHYDNSDTFTIQLSGERRWKFEDSVRLEEKLADARKPDFSPEVEVSFTGPTEEVILQPGDVLYVPAYCVHNVTGVTWSTSLALGLHVYNEVDFVSHLLDTFQSAKYMDYAPVHAFPESAGEPHVAAKMELLRRTRALLKQLEAAAVGSVLAPLSLPGALSPLRTLPQNGNSELRRMSSN